MKNCLVPNCEKKHLGLGFCSRHHARFKRGQNPFEKSLLEKTLYERIEEKIERVPFTECWFWIATVNNKGYGQLNGKYAHRVSYELSNGPIPQGMFVLHSCDVPCCVNPAHLRVGTQKDNMKDAAKRDRIAYGKRLPQYKHGRYATHA